MREIAGLVFLLGLLVYIASYFVGGAPAAAVAKRKAARAA
jgi:hypothetical protein